MFALMGHMYPWASPEALGRLTVRQLGFYLDALPDMERRRHSSSATLAWLVAGFGGKNETEPDDWLPPHARVEAKAQPSRYTPEEAQAMRLAVRWRYMTQDTMNRLDWREVQKAAPK